MAGKVNHRTVGLKLRWDGWHFRAGTLLPGPIIISVIYAESHRVNLLSPSGTFTKNSFTCSPFASVLMKWRWGKPGSRLLFTLNINYWPTSGKKKGNLTSCIQSNIPLMNRSQPNDLYVVCSGKVENSCRYIVTVFFLAWLPFKRDLKG